MSATLKEAKPVAPKVIVENIPAELKALARWVGWKYVYRNDKWDKPPVNPTTGGFADNSDPETWASLEASLSLYVNGRHDGIGFVFHMDDPYTGIDLDNCRDPVTGQLRPWAEHIVGDVDSYTEVSPSGRGVHVIVKGKRPVNGKTRQGNIEIYSHARYFTMTGDRLDGVPESVADRQSALDRVHARMSRTDDEIIRLAMGAANGGKFRRLWDGDVSEYPSPSEADLALCAMLAYWADGDANRVRSLFGRSALARREKWGKREDYRVETIEKAMAGRASEVFTRGTRRRQEYSEKTGSKHIAVTAISTTDVLDPPLGVEEDRDHPSKVEEDRQGKSIQLAVELASDHGKASDWVASFNLARRLRTLSVDEPEQYESAVEAFCVRAGREFEPLWYAFLDCWENVRHAEGEGELAWAAAQAEKCPYPLAYNPGRKCDQYKKLASIAYHLACLTAPKPFWLTRELVAPILNCKHPMEVTRLISLLEKNGVIECVDQSYRYAGPAPKSKEYRFLLGPLDPSPGHSPGPPVISLPD